MKVWIDIASPSIGDLSLWNVILISVVPHSMHFKRVGETMNTSVNQTIISVVNGWPLCATNGKYKMKEHIVQSALLNESKDKNFQRKWLRPPLGSTSRNEYQRTGTLLFFPSFLIPPIVPPSTSSSSPSFTSSHRKRLNHVWTRTNCISNNGMLTRRMCTIVTGHTKESEFNSQWKQRKIDR